MADSIKPADVSYIKDISLSDSLKLAALEDTTSKTRVDSRLGVGAFNADTTSTTDSSTSTTTTTDASNNLAGAGVGIPLTRGALWIQPSFTLISSTYTSDATTAEINFAPPNLTDYQNNYPYVYNTPVVRMWVTNLQYYFTGTATWKQVDFEQRVREIYPGSRLALDRTEILGVYSSPSTIAVVPYIDTGTSSQLGLWFHHRVEIDTSDWTLYQNGMRFQLYYEVYKIPNAVVTIITA